MGAAIVLIVLDFQRQGQELRTRLNYIDAETGEIAAHFKDSLRELSNTRYQYAISHDPAVWEQFLKASGELSLWLDGQALQLTTQGEKDALRQVVSAYDDYLRAAGESPDRPRAEHAPGDFTAGPDAARHPGSDDPAPSSSGRSGASLSEFTRVRAEAQRLFDSGQALVAAHYQSRNQYLAEARQRLAGLQSSILVLLALLFAFGIALAAFAYRDLVAPLRIQLVESQVLAERREKLASLGMLAAGVAHEIRNPLTAINGALFIQQKRFAAGSPERADVALVQREISRLERIVNDFLRFARPSDPELATVSADRLLREVQLFFEPELAKAGIRLVLGDPGPWRVHVDPAQIRQVLINLVQNAVDSIGRDGTIFLRASSDRAWLAGAERSVVVLEVADSGKGIPPEVGRRLFDPFFTTKESGTGLGLSIAARIVEKHRGVLQYQTQVNRGTTFGIVLPEAAS